MRVNWEKKNIFKWMKNKFKIKIRDKIKVRLRIEVTLVFKIKIRVRIRKSKIKRLIRPNNNFMRVLKIKVKMK